MKAFYSDLYVVPLPEGHRFPIEKYAMVREGLVQEGILGREELCPSPLASETDILRVHTSEYFEAVKEGTLDEKIERRIGLPMSPELYIRSRASVGGTIATAQTALQEGIAGNLAGGTHHAFGDRGEGFCVFNDFAIALFKLKEEGKINRAAVIDLDVHQGNGNAALLTPRSEFFVLSIHSQVNYPFTKVPSDLDIGLAKGTGDEDYIRQLAPALERIWEFKPDLVLYQAGVDLLAQDRLGRLNLSREGIWKRDHMVFMGCKKRGIPVAMALGGGYAEPIELTVKAHLGTYRTAREIYQD